MKVSIISLRNYGILQRKHNRGGSGDQRIGRVLDFMQTHSKNVTNGFDWFI